MSQDFAHLQEDASDGARDVEALTAAVAATITTALAVLRSPRIRGPFACPSADNLARSAYLHEFASRAAGAVNRSRRTLGPRRFAEALEAASRLRLAADLMAAIEGAADAAAARTIASASLGRIDALRGWRPRLESRISFGSSLLDLSGWVGELIRGAQRP